jgi:DNA-3-methyladenine glycosylase I
VEKLLGDPGIVRNRLKVASAVSNAQAVLEVQREFGSLDAYLWQFVGGKPKVNRPRAPGDVPARTEQSDAMARALQKRGFRFVGSTICYAFMQAVGMVDDHAVGCFRKRGQQEVDRATLPARHVPSAGETNSPMPLRPDVACRRSAGSMASW